MALNKKLRLVGTSLVVTIPKSIVEIFEWKKGDNINISMNDEGKSLIIKKV